MSAVWSPSLLSRANQGEQQGLQLSFEPPANHAERPVSAHVSQVPGENPRNGTHTDTRTKAAGWNPTQKPAARRLCQPRRRPGGWPPFLFFPSRDPRRSIRNLVPGGRFKSRWRPEAVLAAEEVLLGDTMLSECVLVARRDVFDVRGGMVQAKRSVLIGITLKSGLGVYRQHWGSKRPILLISSAGALNVKARLGTCGEVEGCFGIAQESLN